MCFKPERDAFVYLTLLGFTILICLLWPCPNVEHDSIDVTIVDRKKRTALHLALNAKVRSPTMLSSHDYCSLFYQPLIFPSFRHLVIAHLRIWNLLTLRS